MKRHRVVLDSNVIISGILFQGPPRRILEYAIDSKIECYISLPILDEVRDVLQRPKFGFSPEQALTIAEEIHELCYIVAPGEHIDVIEADPDDNKILECALAADAQLIVSGDSHLLDLSQWQNIQIISPATFASRIASHQH